MKTRTLVASLLALALAAACSKTEPNKPTPQPPANATCSGPEQPAPAKVTWDYQDNLDRNVRWVLDNQREGGFWGDMHARPRDIYLGSLNSLYVFQNASAALCVMGLMMQPPTDEIEKAIERGLEYMITAPDTPRGTMDTFYNVWSNSYMLQSLCYAIQDSRYEKLRPRLKKRADLELKRLMELQALDGGWGYYDFGNSLTRPTGDISTTFSTACVLVALREARRIDLPIHDHNIQIALDYLERLRVPNGAYFYSTGHKYSPMWDPNLPRGSLGRSQGGDNALFTWDRTITPETLEKQLDYFFKDHVFIEIGRSRQYPHEAWYATAPYYYYFGHYYASRNVLGLPREKQPEYGHKLAELVVAGQYDDGSFWDYPLYGYTKAYGSGYGLCILSNCKKAILQEGP